MSGSRPLRRLAAPAASGRAGGLAAPPRPPLAPGIGRGA